MSLLSIPVPIVVDTREIRPYPFNPETASVSRGTLAAGDYSLVGFESRIAIERKSLNDFVGTVIQDRERFARELALLRNYEFACVAIEANIQDVLEHRYSSRAQPASVIGAWYSLLTDYSIPALFLGNRAIAQHVVFGLLSRLYRRASRGEAFGNAADVGASSSESETAA